MAQNMTRGSWGTQDRNHDRAPHLRSKFQMLLSEHQSRRVVEQWWFWGRDGGRGLH